MGSGKVYFKVRELMDAQGLSQLALSEQTGLSTAAIGRLYRNQVARVDIETLEKLIDYFDLSDINDLMTIQRK